MRRIFDLYLQSSIHVSLSIGALTAISYLQFDLPVDFVLLVFTFSSALVGYNFIKYAPLIVNQKHHLISRFPLITYFSLIGVLGTMASLFFISIKVILLAIFLGFFVFWYTFPITRHTQNLRHQPLIKLIVIAFVWASISLLYPILNQQTVNVELSLLWFGGVERMIWVITLMIPFEIRDVVDDKKFGRSVISSIGIAKAKFISIGLLALFIILRRLIYDRLLAIDILIYATLFIMILITSQQQNRYFSSFWVESLPILWLIFSLIYS